MGKTTRNADKKKEAALNHISKKEDRKAKQMLRKQRNRVKDFDTTEEKEFRSVLETLRLVVKFVDGDGNCMFRSLADQLEGNQDSHHKYRAATTNYIVENMEYFKLFIEDDEPFEDYVSRMRQHGEWGESLADIYL